MFRPLELFIGLRYTRAKRRNQFISFISTVSIVCIAISVVALITVMSVMNGFDYQMRSRILGAISHATVSGIGESVQDWPRALQIAEANPHVLGAAPYVETEAYLNARRSSGALVRGVEPAQEPRVVDIDKHMLEGKLAELTPGSWNIVLGRELAMTLGVTVGDRITMVVQQLRATPMGSVPRMRSFHVVGTFELGMEQFDSGLALVNMSDAEKLNDLSGPTGIRLKLDDLFNARPVARELADQLGQVYRVQTWMDTNANLFAALSMEKMVMFIILSLIILVAVINLISMLMMLVTDKQADIAILRTLGATPRSIMGMFMVQGVLVGFVGIGFGVGFGSLLSWKLPGIIKWIEHTFHVTFLSPDVYYISEVPSRLDWQDVGWTALLTFAFSLLATLYPAWRASRTQPAQALRYE
ncbi:MULTISPECIES: lipoprotein-releasing ABC transporter permease subunit [Rhodanobacter]|uniref:lipoprotein-releasing ABC transporter permease subunit n=1 Tax=Rhodanobacter TaxID=75309 RepID=UPI000260EA43|nr:MULTISPECIES: lipoprotein-releasing ABC transporter permease subunit [Rhodanobacter]EIM03807.1 lipoprotein releasing system transmembrane protein LolC/E family [Rhodanobacter denitrificans]KZC19915.1 cell division protein FtsX [Rhodanobacter denitrificans]UJJ49671.1 lipoprotein-releasing ABC transporter permease subunit [Rhodanobacter denitrificans]UJJ58135.1 lipoprotein-releasing ABC transporter permease subunit [Rhodanobacter denitrificans]UJM88636.1 lipoprotein-releasing ABC transporter 